MRSLWRLRGCIAGLRYRFDFPHILGSGGERRVAGVDTSFYGLA
jgi:hypothetical protein